VRIGKNGKLGFGKREQVQVKKKTIPQTMALESF